MPMAPASTSLLRATATIRSHRLGPTAKHIVYRTTGPDADGLRIMNLDERSITVLTNEWDNFPVWSPRGDLIAFIRRNGADFNVFTIHPDGTGVKQLTDMHGINAHLAWSPDGERLLFASSRMGFKDEVCVDRSAAALR